VVADFNHRAGTGNQTAFRGTRNSAATEAQFIIEVVKAGLDVHLYFIRGHRDVKEALQGKAVEGELELARQRQALRLVFEFAGVMVGAFNAEPVIEQVLAVQLES
jgi:hypothetical protein